MSNAPERPEERIDRILDKLGKAWKEYPDQRLAQVVSNAAALGGWKPVDPYYCEDDVIESGLNQLNILSMCKGQDDE